MVSIEDYDNDGGRADIMQSLDDEFGPALERAVQRYVPRDKAREIRRDSIRGICDKLMNPDKISSDDDTKAKPVSSMQSSCRGSVL